MNTIDHTQLLKSYQHRGFRLVLLKPRSKVPLVKWRTTNLFTYSQYTKCSFPGTGVTYREWFAGRTTFGKARNDESLC